MTQGNTADADPPPQETPPGNALSDAIDPTHAAIGRSIKAHRLVRRLKLAEVADEIGMDRGNLSRLEGGKHTLTLDRINSLAKIFKVTIAELFENPLGEDWDGTPPKVLPTLNPQKAASAPPESARTRVVTAYKTLAEIPAGALVLVNRITSRPNAIETQPSWGIDTEMPIKIPGLILSNLHSKPGDLAAINVANDAMAPTLCRNDVVVIDVSDQLVPSTGGVFAVAFPGQPVELRRLSAKFDGYLTVSCDDKQHPSIDLSPAERKCILIIGRAKVSFGSGGL